MKTSRHPSVDDDVVTWATNLLYPSRLHMTNGRGRVSLCGFPVNYTVAQRPGGPRVCPDCVRVRRRVLPRSHRGRRGCRARRVVPATAATMRPGERIAMDTSAGAGEEKGRWPRRVFDVGQEPDPRFSLANERTFLAWIRTALGLLAAGIALDVFVHDVHPVLRRSIALVLIAVGTWCGISAYARWMSTERALRLGRALPAPRSALLVGCAVVGVGLLAALLILLGR